MRLFACLVVVVFCLQECSSLKLSDELFKALNSNKNVDILKEKLRNNQDFIKMIVELSTCKKPEITDVFNKIPQDDIKKMQDDHPLISATTPEIVMYYGYPVETHYVTTEDGYKLEIHRIPCPKTGCEPGEIREPVIVQHGVLCSSADFVVNPPHQALGYLLVDAGYDVWLPNFKGNQYSKNHIEYETNTFEFWDFSWDEKGEYDIPAIIDYILYRTGFQQLYYVGHSMGTTTFFVMCDKRPEYVDKVKAFFAMAPVATLDNMKSPLSLLAPFTGFLEWLMIDLLGMYQFLPGGFFNDVMARLFCDDGSFTQIICSNIMFLIGGYNQKQLNTTMLPVYMSITPAGVSTKTMVHFGQSCQSGIFRDYDYGEDENIEIYGNTAPPLYDLSKVTVPTYVYWGANDWMTDEVDVMELAAQLRNLRLLHRVDDDQYNHLDFMWGIGSRTLLYDPIIKELSSMELPFKQTQHPKLKASHKVVYHKKDKETHTKLVN